LHDRSAANPKLFSALLNTGMNSRFPNGYRQSMVSFVTSSEKVIHTMNQQRQNPNACSQTILISG